MVGADRTRLRRKKGIFADGVTRKRSFRANHGLRNLRHVTHLSRHLSTSLVLTVVKRLFGVGRFTTDKTFSFAS
jgi:hypothetical protein